MTPMRICHYPRWRYDNWALFFPGRPPGTPVFETHHTEVEVHSGTDLVSDTVVAALIDAGTGQW